MAPRSFPAPTLAWAIWSWGPNLLWAKGLVLADLALVFTIGILQDFGPIPGDVWVQYPLLILGGLLVGYLARAHMQDQEKWRQALIDEQFKSRQYMEQMLQQERQILLEIIKSMQTGHDKNITSVVSSQRDAYEEAMERMLDAMIKIDGYEPLKQSRRRERSEPHGGV